MKTFSARETVWLQELDGIELAGFRRRAFAFLIDWMIVGILLSVTFTLGALVYIGIAKARGHNDVNINFGEDKLSTKLESLDHPDETAHPDEMAASKAESKPACTAEAPPAPVAPPPHKHVQFNRLHPDESVIAEVGNEALKIFADIVVPCLYFGLFLWRWNGRTPGKRWMKIRVVSLVHTHMSFWHSVERALGYGAAALEGGFGFIQYFIHPYRRCAQDRLAETIVVTERSYQQRFPKAHGTPSEADTLPV